MELICLQNRCFDSIRQVSPEFTHLATWTVASLLMTVKLQISDSNLFSHQMNGLVIPALEAASLSPPSVSSLCALAPHSLPGPEVCSGRLRVSPHAVPAPFLSPALSLQGRGLESTCQGFSPNFPCGRRATYPSLSFVPPHQPSEEREKLKTKDIFLSVIPLTWAL